GRRSCQARVIGHGYQGTWSDCAPLPESCVRCSRDARRHLGPRRACRAKVVPSRSAVRPHLNCRSLAVVVLTLLLTQRADAEQRMAVVGGVGFTFPAIQKDPEAPKVQGVGGYAEASYYYRFSDWVRPMVYSGLHITVPNQDCGHDFLDC